MKTTFIIYKVERFTFKNEIVFETTSKEEANKKYSELNAELNAESNFSYQMRIK